MAPVSKQADNASYQRTREAMSRNAAVGLVVGLLIKCFMGRGWGAERATLVYFATQNRNLSAMDSSKCSLCFCDRPIQLTNLKHDNVPKHPFSAPDKWKIQQRHLQQTVKPPWMLAPKSPGSWYVVYQSLPVAGILAKIKLYVKNAPKSDTSFIT